jgi:molybdopterin biosynthesis enzyme
MFSGMTRADCLVIRPPFAPPASAGDSVSVLMLGGSLISA